MSRAKGLIESINNESKNITLKEIMDLVKKSSNVKEVKAMVGLDVNKNYGAFAIKQKNSDEVMILELSPLDKSSNHFRDFNIETLNDKTETK